MVAVSFDVTQRLRNCEIPPAYNIQSVMARLEINSSSGLFLFALSDFARTFPTALLHCLDAACESKAKSDD
jgi:hypothetical protein